MSESTNNMTRGGAAGTDAEQEKLILEEHKNDEKAALLARGFTGVEGSVKGTEEGNADQDEYSDSDRSKTNKVLLGMYVKKETTIYNLIAMPMLPFITCCVNFYSMTFLPLLLENKDYFAIPTSELGRANSIVIIWS